MWNYFQIRIICRDISGVTSDCPCVWCRRLTICFLCDVWLCKGSLNNKLDCLHLRQWQVTYLMTLYDWTMSCQPGPPRVRHGQWPRWQQRPVGYTFPYKMANFHGVYLKFGRIDSANFLIWYNETCLSSCHKLSKWYNEPVLCYCRIKICNFAMSKKGPSHYFHLYARAPPMAVPGCVDEIMVCEWK